MTTVYQHLFDEARKHGLHVELWTDHRSKNAKDPALPDPQVTQLIISDAKRKVLHRAPAGLRSLDVAASRALAELPR